jgi:DNA-binding response OmpR family regulator
MPAHGRDVSVLLVGHEPSIRDTYALIFHKAGYIAHAIGPEDLEPTLKGTVFAMAVMDHTLSKEERTAAVQAVRKLTPRARTVALHCSGRDSGADVVMDSRDGADAILEALAELVDGNIRS